MDGRPGSGLSSSSALLCAAVLAVLAAGGVRPAKAVSLAALGPKCCGHSGGQSLFVYLVPSVHQC